MVFSDPVLQAAVAPFVIAFIAVGIGRVIGGGGDVIAGLGAVGACLLAYVQWRGAPPLPPTAALEELPYLIGLAGLIGLGLDLSGRPPNLDRLALAAFPALCVARFALPALLAGPGWALLLRPALYAAGGVIFLWRLSDASARGGGLVGGIGLGLTAAGAAGLAHLAAAPGILLLCAAFAAVAAAVALWGYGVHVLSGARTTLGATTLLGIGGGLVALVQLLLLSAPAASWPAAALLLAVPFADVAAERFSRGSGGAGRVIGPLLLAAVAAIPALAAIGLACLLPGR